MDILSLRRYLPVMHTYALRQLGWLVASAFLILSSVSPAYAHETRAKCTRSLGSLEPLTKPARATWTTFSDAEQDSVVNTLVNILDRKLMTHGEPIAAVQKTIRSSFEHALDASLEDVAEDGDPKHWLRELFRELAEEPRTSPSNVIYLRQILELYLS